MKGKQIKRNRAKNKGKKKQLYIMGTKAFSKLTKAFS